MIEKSLALPTVVLVGRTNVGKSTLYNKLTHTHGALVSPIAGTTRDRREGVVRWNGVDFTIMDTGGIDLAHPSELPVHKKKRIKIDSGPSYARGSESFAKEIEYQTAQALPRATLILFLVDGKEGLLPQERSWARALQKIKKPVLVVVNKIDAPKFKEHVHEFWTLGFGEPVSISAVTGAGTGDLLDLIVRKLGEPTPPAFADLRFADGFDKTRASAGKEKQIRLALIGRPNVGKSSLMNAILGEDRVIVSPIAHTTREPIDTHFVYGGHEYTLIDTAGIRKGARVNPGLEQAGVSLSLRALDRTDVALFVIESQEQLGAQDMHIARAIIDRNVGCIIVANKWDLYRQNLKSQISNSKAETDSVKNYTTYIQNHLPHLSWAPILFVSAVTKRNVERILDTAVTAMRERERMISNEELQEFMKRLIYRPSAKNKKMRKPNVYGLKQKSACPPSFELVTEWTNVMTQRGKQKGTVRASYMKFVENRLRERFGFLGSPIIFTVRTIEH
ncbi:MAG: ribosome biogenesis GTPase Der [Candidatus Yonathbacteria bacterium]|nr:ribosome biogenesis GTPase Der [Candidatus Yonathbacteria bacterium]